MKTKSLRTETEQLETTLQATNNARLQRGDKRAVNIVLSDQIRYQGKMWPWSKFEKVDILQCALQGHNPLYAHTKLEDEPTQGLMKFPAEIFVHIFEILNAWGKLKPKYMRVCKLFYLLILPIIYLANHN